MAAATGTADGGGAADAGGAAEDRSFATGTEGAGAGEGEGGAGDWTVTVGTPLALAFVATAGNRTAGGGEAGVVATGPGNTVVARHPGLGSAPMACWWIK